MMVNWLLHITVLQIFPVGCIQAVHTLDPWTTWKKEANTITSMCHSSNSRCFSKP